MKNAKTILQVLVLILVPVLIAAAQSPPVVSGIVTISGHAEDLDSGLDGNMSFYFNGGWIGDSAPATPGASTFDGSFVWDSASVTNGTGVVTAQMLDVAGNTGVSADYTVDVQNVDNEPPTVTILSIDPVP